MSSSIEAQRQRYNQEALAYESHHAHALNQAYRDEFIRNKLFTFSINGKRVLDGMCASGIETGYLLSKGAIVTGLDISENNIEIYKQKWNCDSIVASIHDANFPDETFDVIYIFGGLHHILPFLDQTIANIHRILKKDGRFIFVEPNKDTFLSKFRAMWYKLDKRFQEEEQSISYQNLKDRYKDFFKENQILYGGNFAYLIIDQSLILGTPNWLKNLSWRFLFFLERTIGSTILVPKLFFGASWTKI